jgi:uncharacterized Zn-binding protein involved in type VI secretion
MSYGIAVRTLDIAGGRQLGGGQSAFIVDGQPVIVLGDAVEPHAPPVHKAPIKMVQASGWMSINGTPVCRAGHLASCGHASTGRGWFEIPD